MTTESAKPATETVKEGHAVPWRVHLRRRAALVTRWLHIYLSMGSFAAVLFFAFTGLTLNHPEWFAGRQRTVVKHGVVSLALLKGSTSADVDKLGLVEMLRAQEHVHGAVSDVRVDDSQVTISLRAPGYTADAFIDRATGKYDLTEVSSGFVAVINDLHKDRDSGKAWGYVIDASAVLLVLVSITGLLLLWFLHKRRAGGYLLAAFCAAAVVIFYRCLVP